MSQLDGAPALQLTIRLPARASEWLCLAGLSEVADSHSDAEGENGSEEGIPFAAVVELIASVRSLQPLCTRCRT